MINHRRLRLFLSGHSSRQHRPRSNFLRHEAMFVAASWLVRFYYAASLFFAYSLLQEVRQLGRQPGELELLWPVFWIEYTDVASAATFLALFFMISALFAVAAPGVRIFRILVVVALLQSAAFQLSFGAMSHSYHMWLWVGVCFVFLPSQGFQPQRVTRAVRTRFLAVFAMAQGLVLLFYTMSGLWKAAAATAALFNGEIGGFSPSAMAITLANRSLQTGTDPVLAPLIIENYWLGWPLYLGLIYAELVAFVVLFRPDLHKLWGFILICFHFGTWLCMEIWFPRHVLVLTLLFVFSPFAPASFSWRRALLQLPLFASLVNVISLRRQSLASGQAL